MSSQPIRLLVGPVNQCLEAAHALGNGEEQVGTVIERNVMRSKKSKEVPTNYSAMISAAVYITRLSDAEHTKMQTNKREKKKNSVQDKGHDICMVNMFYEHFEMQPLQ